MPEPASGVLIIDNDRVVFDILSKHNDNFAVCMSYASTLREGLLKNRNDSYRVILMRDSLSDGDACYAVRDFQNNSQSPEIILFTSKGDPVQAEIALKNGVWEYAVAPCPEKSLPELLQQALRYRLSKKGTEHLVQSILHEQARHHGIIGQSGLIQKCIDFAANIALSEANVLISGETGTGKELFTTFMHNLSSRAVKDLIIVDCAALPTTLVESILFGHVKGSFTGADKAQPGILKQSDEGTLFLDEVAEMPLEVQKKFLRVIQERKYLPVGDSVETKCNFRLIAATNKDLYAMVKEGTFREDLLFRLRTFHLELPPLRARPTDIPELAASYRDQHCRQKRIQRKKFSPEYLMFLTEYDWPGNVRELFQTIECSITNARDGSILYSKHLPLHIRIQITKNKITAMDFPGSNNSRGDAPETALNTMPPLKSMRDRAIADQEKRYLQQLFLLTEKNIKKCCEISGLSRSRLYDLLKKYKLLQK